MADEVIGGYRLLKHMVTGQTSQVWEVRDASGRHFAMKLLLPEKAAQGTFRRFLLHEAEVGQKLAHPNIIRIVAVGRDPKNPYYVMEYFPAGNLKLRIMRMAQEVKQRGAAQKERDFIREKGQDILKQAATGLAFMNAQGWVHRDVKPDNMLVNSAGEVKLIDFGLAQRIPRGLARTFWIKKRSAGTLSYISPEQIRGAALDGRADVYSFGASAYELAAGRPPFRGSSGGDLLNKQIREKPVSPEFYNPDVTKEFGELVLRMLAKKREDRPKDFHEVLIAMRSLRVFKSADKAPAGG